VDLSDQARFPQKLKLHLAVEVKTIKLLDRPRPTILQEPWPLRLGSQSLQLCLGLLVSGLEPVKLDSLDVR